MLGVLVERRRGAPRGRVEKSPESIGEKNGRTELVAGTQLLKIKRALRGQAGEQR